MQHPESLENLPVMIISVLADDNLNESRKNQLRSSWASMGLNRNFLEFIQAYAISKLLHSKDQIKYFTSHERALFMANKHNLTNIEAYFGGGSYNGGRAGRSVGGVISDDNAGDFFEPLHNVFGGQTGLEASDSALAFENQFNVLTDSGYRMRDNVHCSSCDNGAAWTKPWSDVLPNRQDGKYYVADIAEWLWVHVVGNLDNYTDLERAYLYSFLGAARVDPGGSDDGERLFDFNLLMCVVEDYQLKESTTAAPIASILSGSSWNDYCTHGDDGVDGYSQTELDALNRVFTGQEIADDILIQNVLSQLGEFTLPFNANDSAESRKRVNNTLSFIFTTPFVFAEGQ
jgi:hypothetical protein